MKFQKSVKNAHLSFPEPNITSSNCFFCPNSSQKHNDSLFIIINDTKKQQTLIFVVAKLAILFTFFFFLITETSDYQNSLAVPDGRQAQSNGEATFTWTRKHSTHLHETKTITRGMQLYSVYSGKLCYQLTTDVSDSAVRVRHSRQEPRGMNKLRAGNDRKCILQ